MRGVSFILIIFAFLFSGCVVDKSRYENQLIFTKPISPISQNSKIYVKFTNTSRADSNLTATFREFLRADGYMVVDSESQADISIKGNLEYFRRTIIKDRDPFLEYCSPRARFWGECYDKRTNSYIYDAALTLLITKDGIQEKTTLNFKSKKNINSLSTMMEIFNRDVYSRVLRGAN